MKAIECVVGRIRPFGEPVPLPLQLDGRNVELYIDEGAADHGPQLALKMDYSQLDVAGVAPEATPFFLHKALRKLTRNATGSGCVSRIGIVLADKFVHDEGAFGYMFDTGFDPGIGDQSFNHVAREGCAIFLDAIRAKRQGSPDYQTEVAFTIVHELGHIFNLWHVTTPSLMAQSPSSAPFGSGAFRFLKIHRSYLTEMDSRFVCPGGSHFEERGDLVIPPEGSFNAAESPRVWLHLDLSQSEFWRFEPSQLNVTVSTSKGVEVARIPNVIDPGYDAFDIWIEAPDGTRVRYRSPVKYCGSRKQLTIRRGRPFRRDIPLFGQSGGYTFKVAGPHRIFCTLRLRGGVVTSNIVEGYVKPASRRDQHFRSVASLLTSRDNAQTLFYGSTLKPSAIVKPLAEASRKLAGTPAAANIQYSVAKALTTWTKVGSVSPSDENGKAASRLIRTALDSGLLSPSRQAKAVELLTTFDAA